MANGILGNVGQAFSSGGPLGGVSDWLNQNPYAMLSLGMGLLSGKSTSDAFGNGLQGLLTGSQYDQRTKTLAEQQAEKKAQQAAIDGLFTGHWGKGLAGAQPTVPAPPGTRELFKAFPTQAVDFAFKSMMPKTDATATTDDIKEFNFAKNNGYKGSFTDFLNVKRTGAGSTKTSLVPIWGEDENGNSVLGQPTDQGTLIKTQLPEGFKPSKGVEKLDAGDHWILYDKQTGQAIGTEPKKLTQAAADTAAGVDQASDLKTANNNSLKATSSKNTIALLRAAAADPNFYSGAFADQLQAAKKLAVALGADPNLTAASENFESLSNQLVKDRLGTLGTGVSNADVQFLSKTVPTLQMTPQGNRQLLDIIEKLADRDIEIARVAQQYAKEHGGGTRLDQNWSSYLADWAQAHPLFGGGGASGAGGGSPGAGLPPVGQTVIINGRSVERVE